jgi:hypothetical protein
MLWPRLPGGQSRRGLGVVMSSPGRSQEDIAPLGGRHRRCLGAVMSSQGRSQEDKAPLGGRHRRCLGVVILLGHDSRKTLVVRQLRQAQFLPEPTLQIAEPPTNECRTGLRT